jgi:2-polyprenyl-3-methyl-5-hydroxy-6-metoxy-1,4-benzoquinol methylase
MDAIKFHSEISKKFDDHYHTSSLFQNRLSVWASLINKYLKPGENVLDAGCGSGVLSFYICKLGNKVVAFDGSEEMIELCKKKMTSQADCNVDFFVETLPLKNSAVAGQFDMIISSSVLEYVEDYALCINNFKGRLKENGLLLLSMPNRKSLYRRIEKITYALTKKPRYLGYVKNMFTVSEFRSIMQANGFEEIENIEYSSDGAINKLFKILLLPKKYRNSLFVGVYKKNNSSLR